MASATQASAVPITTGAEEAVLGSGFALGPWAFVPASDDVVRIVMSLVVLASLWLCMRVSRRWSLQRLAGVTETVQRQKLREKAVWVKNMLILAAVIALVAIWASKIAGLALSLAFAAGGILLVSKELLMCLLGYLMLGLSRPYRLGDYIEISDLAGRVVDIEPLTTTLQETAEAGQLTSRQLIMPNSLVLSFAVRNSGAGQHFVTDVLALVVPFEVDMAMVERCALEAAEHVTHPWLPQAQAALERQEGRSGGELPSAQPKVLWCEQDLEERRLLLRFSCRRDQRVTTQQAVVREFWRRFEAAGLLASSRDAVAKRQADPA